MQFLVVGQWQGSASSRAMRLGDGAIAIAADLPRASTTVVDVPTGAGDRLETAVARYTSVLAVADRVAEETAVATEPVLVVGGDGASVLGATVGLGPGHRVRPHRGVQRVPRTQPCPTRRRRDRRPADAGRPRRRAVPRPARAPRLVGRGRRGPRARRRRGAALDRAGIARLDVDAATPDALAAAVERDRCHVGVRARRPRRPRPVRGRRPARTRAVRTRRRSVWSSGSRPRPAAAAWPAPRSPDSLPSTRTGQWTTSA